MRAVVVYLTLLLLLALSIGAGTSRRLAAGAPATLVQRGLAATSLESLKMAVRRNQQPGNRIRSCPQSLRTARTGVASPACFHGALALLRWDAAVMMPREVPRCAASNSRARDGDPRPADCTEDHALLDRAQANAAGLEDWQLANLREMRRARDHAIATPVSLISRLARATSRAEFSGRGASPE